MRRVRLLLGRRRDQPPIIERYRRLGGGARRAGAHRGPSTALPIAAGRAHFPNASGERTARPGPRRRRDGIAGFLPADVYSHAITGKDQEAAGKWDEFQQRSVERTD